MGREYPMMVMPVGDSGDGTGTEHAGPSRAQGRDQFDDGGSAARDGRTVNR